MIVVWQQGLAQPYDLREIDAIPVDRRRGIDSKHRAIQTRSEIDHDRVGILRYEPADARIQQFRPQRHQRRHAGGGSQAREVEVDLTDRPVSQAIAQDRTSRPAVECAAVLGKQCGLFNGFKATDVHTVRQSQT